MWQGVDWLVDAVFKVLWAVGRGSGDGDLAAFGASYTTLIPKGDVTRISDAIFGRVGRAWTPNVGNTRARIYALGLNQALSQACITLLSLDQRVLTRQEHPRVGRLV